MIKSIGVFAFSLALLLTSETASAMQFSWPVILGNVATPTNHSMFLARNELPTSVNKQYYDFGSDPNHIIRLYLTDTVRALGDVNDPNNTVSLDARYYPDIYEIATDGELRFYVVIGSGQQYAEGINVDVIGKKNGKFVKFAGRVFFQGLHDENKYGPMGNVCRLSVQGNQLILDCEKSIWDRNGLVERKKWQYVLTWKNREQEFQVEYRPL